MAKRNMQNWLSYMPMVLVLCGLFYINLHKTIQTMTVKAESQPTTLYFPGVVAPLAYFMVLSPMQGIITEVHVPYGQWVKKGDLLYVMDSPQLADSYRQAMEDLVRATNAYQNLLYQNNGNKELFKLGLISKVAYMDNTQQLQSSDLDLLEAREKINRLLLQTGQKPLDFEHLSLEKLQDIRDTLKKPLKRINILATEDGVLYFPSKTFNSDEEKPQRIARGTNIKEGQTLAIIGNMTSLLMEVSVGETDFHKIFVGEKAHITGTAFPDLTLEGVVKNISKQANTSQNDNTPFYTISVIVPALTEKQRKTIEVGMSAEVRFTTENPPVISIPLNAISEKNGSFWVKLLDKNDKVKEVAVVTGLTDQDTIQIVKGLSSGDKIVLPD